MSQRFPVEDSQIAGSRDNGTPHGVVDVDVRAGELCMVPFKGGTFVIDGGAVYYAGGFGENQDGSGSVVIITVAAGAAGTGGRIAFTVWGNVFGLRYLRHQSSTPPFGVMIDGRDYSPANYAEHYYSDRGLTTPTDSHCQQVLARDLGDGPHHVEITVAQHPTLQRVLRLYGYVVERRAGYQQPPPRCHLGDVLTLTTVAAGIYNPSVISAPPALHKVVYRNTHTAAVRVTIKQSTIVLEDQLLAAKDSPGDRWEWVPSDKAGFASNTGFTHAADVTGVVRATLYTGW